MVDLKPTNFIYLDTNVLAYLSKNEVVDFIPVAVQAGSELVTSDIALAELTDGAASAIFSRHRFVYVYAHEPAFLSGKVKFYSNPPTSEISTDIDLIEIFLRGMLRLLAGSSRVADDVSPIFPPGLGRVLGLSSGPMRPSFPV